MGTMCSMAHTIFLFSGSIFPWQSANQSNPIAAHFLKLPAEGSPGLSAQLKSSHSISARQYQLFHVLTLGGSIPNSCRP